MAETEFLQTAIEAARLAGSVLEEWSAKFTVSEKSRANLVTEADFASQDVIFKHISAQFPDHNFLGEEGLSTDNGTSPYRWVIDPLDGTSNYVHGFPYYCVSIALECNKELVVGVVFDPNRQEMFSAVKGNGAELNNRPIRTSDVAKIGDVMAVASLPIGAGRDDPAIARFLRIMPHVQTVQRTGSAALNLVYVAAGRIETFWSTSLKPWDVAAGALIAQEAGGVVTKIDGLPLDIEISDLLATNTNSIHEQMQELLVCPQSSS